MRNYKNIKISVLWILLLTLLMLITHCSVRKHTNVFDPKSGIDTLDMKLELRSADSIVTLSWIPHYDTEIKGFHLYRRAGNQTQFSSLAILPAGQTEYRDSLVQFDTPYAYYLTLIGASGESPPTPVLKTVPGPGQIWVLDRWNEYILKFSYDMRHRLLSHYAIWIPQALAFNKQKTLAVITYPLYHYAEVIDPTSGLLKQEITDIRYPYACAFNPKSRAFYISDSIGALYQFTPNGSVQLLDGELGKPEEIVFDAQGNAAVLDSYKKALILYQADGTRRAEITGFNGHRFRSLRFLSVNQAGSYFYFIERNDTSDVLFRLSTLTDSISPVFEGQGLRAVRESPMDHSLWLAVNSDNGANILQLSPSGLRLNTLNGFKFITDIAVNPINGNLIIADRDAHQVIHVRSDGSRIGVFKEAPYPFKVYIE